jgi:outer membrane protein OmpA-like peptidoglycan-associated protein
MKRLIGSAVVALGLVGSGTALAGSQDQQASSDLERRHEKLSDGYKTTVTTPPGQKPSVRVTVEQKGWKQWQQQKSEELARIRAENSQLRQQLAQLQGEQSLEGVANVKQDERGIILTLNGGVLFEFGKDELLPDAKSKLDTLAQVLQQAPDAKFTVEGHTDSKGSADYNKQLSERRAEAVKDYLVSKGIAAANIEAVGRGEDEAIASNASPEGRANNRRVEVVLPEGALGIGGAGGAGQDSTKQQRDKKTDDSEAAHPPTEEPLP